MTARGVTVESLVEAIPDSRMVGPGGMRVSGVAHDSRLIQPGNLFAALRGGDFDGHAFVEEAAQRGAAALLVETPVASPLPQILTADSRAALAIAAAEIFGRPSEAIGVIGVTGTDGKTTTAHLVDHILWESGLRTGMVGTVAIRIGGSRGTPRVAPDDARVE